MSWSKSSGTRTALGDVVSVQEINGMEGDVITMSELFGFERKGVDKEGKVIGGLKATGIIPAFHKDLKAKGIEIPMEVFEPTWLDKGR